MKCAGRNTMMGSAAIFALFMLLSTGCAKEEVAAPRNVVPVLQPKALHNNAPGTIDPGNTDSQGISPITDDGDDLGDNERSSKDKH